MRTLLLLFLLFPLLLLSQNTDCNCCSDANQAFDFWIGTWEVTNADGTPAGKNTIRKEEKGCVLRENWTSAKTGFTGTSLNFYNQQSKQWEQLWVDNAGNHLKLKGDILGKQMILASDEFVHTDGQKYVNKITWTLNDDGTVNQLWEILQGNEVKQVAFNGLYRKVE